MGGCALKFLSFYITSFLSVVFLCPAIGCSSQSPKMYPVSGEVSIQGEPMQAGSVTLHPDGSRGNRSLEIAGGQVNSGKYQIFTGERRGAPPGFYKVLVISTNFSGDNPPPMGPTAQMPRSLIDPKYGQPGQTPLALEVVAEPDPGAYDLEVTK